MRQGRLNRGFATIVLCCAIFTIPHIVGAQAGLPDVLVDRLDQNGDGALSKSEIPRQMKRLYTAFDYIDANADGKISADELYAMSSRRLSKTVEPTSHPQPEKKPPETTAVSAVGDGPDAIRRRMQKAIADQELPGAVILFIKNGEVVFEEVYGYADREAKRKQQMDDIFNLGSTSKPVAMTAVMTQVATGKINLEDPVGKWMPEYNNKKLVDGTRAKRSPYVREMMSHVSGTFANKCGERRDLSLLYMFKRTLRESAEAIAAKPLVYQPGEKFCYCGPSMQVLGRIIEKITDEDFDGVAKAEVFSPLDMKDTFYRTDKDLSKRIAVIYEKTGNKLRRSRRTRDPRGDKFILVPGGVYSTAHDLSRFIQAHLQDGVLNGQRVWPENLVIEMRRNQIGDLEMDFGDPSVKERNSAALGDIQGYGLGWILDEVRSDGSARIFSHGGAWGTYIWGDVEEQIGAVLLTQTPLPNATPVWNDVLSIARATWSSVDTPKSIGGWKPEVKRISKYGAHYIDPEILHAENLMTFQDQAGSVWLSRLNPDNGFFMSDDGKEILMGKGAFNLRKSYNGPEFGLDSKGWAVYFTKLNDGVPQIWRSQLVDGKPISKAFTTDKQRRQSIMASKDAKSPTTRLLYIQGQLGDGYFYWMDESRPAKETGIVHLKEVDSPRWINDTLKFVYVESDGKDAGQLKLTDSVTGKVRTITNDEGIKAYAYGWEAPEFGGETLVLALINYNAVGVWRDTGKKYWQRIATLTPPQGSKYKNFGSPEPFTVNGKSYISLVIKDKNTRGRFKDSEVWIMGIESGPSKRFARRVDDGESPVMRSDPEAFVGNNEVFLYYNAIGKDRVYEIHRASTGLSYLK